MKRKISIVLVLFILLIACNACVATAGGLGNYSHGYRMGQITKFSIKGFVMKSGEGQMLMGSESTPYIITDTEGNTTTINPWYFSVSNENMRNTLSSNIGEYLVLEYNVPHIAMSDVDTLYEVIGVTEISPPLNKVCIANSYVAGEKSNGERVGRIVKASKKGLVSYSYEIMFQQGNSGAQFKNMSISNDTELYQCAIDFLKTGQRVKITYNESLINLNFLGRNTKYDIVKIEPLKSAAQSLN